MVELSKGIPSSLNALTRWLCSALTAVLITGCGSFAALSAGADTTPVGNRLDTISNGGTSAIASP